MILVSPLTPQLTDNSLDDHSRYAMWLGAQEPLKLDTLRRTYRPERRPSA